MLLLLLLLLVWLVLDLQVVTSPIIAFVTFIVNLVTGMFIWPKRYTVRTSQPELHNLTW